MMLDGVTQPNVRQLLSARVQTNFRDRGVNPNDVLREEPRRPSREMTEEEKQKLERKREKNREHAKLSRERRNIIHAKTQQENKVLKAERGILRQCLGRYYTQLHGRKLAWRQMAVECLLSLTPKSSETVAYIVELPDDAISQRLSPLCKAEELHRVVELYSSRSNGQAGSVREEDQSGSAAADVGIDIPQRRRTTEASSFSRSLEPMTPTPSSYGSLPESHDFLLDESSVESMKDTFPFISSPQKANTENVGASHEAGKVRFVPGVPGNRAQRGFTIKEEMNDEDDSPWMVKSARETKAPEILFDKENFNLKNPYVNISKIVQPAQESLVVRPRARGISFSLELKKPTETMKSVSPVEGNIRPPSFKETHNADLSDRKPILVPQTSVCRSKSVTENAHYQNQTYQSRDTVPSQEYEVGGLQFQDNAMEETTMFAGDHQTTGHLVPVAESSMDDMAIDLDPIESNTPCFSNGLTDLERPMFFNNMDLFLTSAPPGGFGGQAIANEPPSNLSSLNLGGMEFEEDLSAIQPTFLSSNYPFNTFG